MKGFYLIIVVIGAIVMIVNATAEGDEHIIWVLFGLFLVILGIYRIRQLNKKE